MGSGGGLARPGVEWAGAPKVGLTASETEMATALEWRRLDRRNDPIGSLGLGMSWVVARTGADPLLVFPCPVLPMLVVSSRGI